MSIELHINLNKAVTSKFILTRTTAYSLSIDINTR